jgi:hypothetical protein
MKMETITRNADLSTLRDMLLEQHARKVDIVAPASKIRSEDGIIVVKGADPILTDDGVTSADGRYQPTRVFDEGISGKLNIPLPYVRRLRETRPDLYDANVNGWLHGKKALVRYTPSEGSQTLREAIEGDSRSFMIRTFRGDDGGFGVARAILSDRYKTIDNLDALTATLAGVQQAGAEVNIVGCDLTERRMYVRIEAPAIRALAPALLAGYHSPYNGRTVEECPFVFAGLEIGNSEVGNGSWSITPRMIFEVCDNGMKVTKDAVRAVHLGAQQEESVIEWSRDTESKDLALITAKARDAVATFLNVDYMTKVIEEASEKAGVALKGAPDQAIRTVAKKLAFSEETTAGVLDAFIRGGQVTAGGVFQAVTAFAGQVKDADLAADLEGDAFKALDVAAAL